MRRFANLESLPDHDVDVIAISRDSVADVRRHVERDGLPFEVLSDANGAVISSLGLEIRHMRYVTWFPHTLPIGIPLGFRRMAIPTSILVDEEGVIRWIDQSEDYRMRSDSGRVASALEQAFG